MPFEVGLCEQLRITSFQPRVGWGIVSHLGDTNIVTPGKLLLVVDPLVVLYSFQFPMIQPHCVEKTKQSFSNQYSKYLYLPGMVKFISKDVFLPPLLFPPSHNYYKH